MSLTFDYVTMPPKSQEISQIQTNEINRTNQEHQQMAAQFQEQVKQTSERTIRREKAENEELKNEEDRRRRQQKKKKNASAKDGKSQDKGEKEKQTEKPVHFDMRI